MADVEPQAIDVFFALEPDAPRAAVAGWLASFVAAGIACDTDYAGRSLKGQLTQAGASARDDRRRGADGATIRRAGSADEIVDP